VHKDLKEFKGMPELKDQVAQAELADLKGILVHKDLKGFKEIPELKDLKDQAEQLETSLVY
jgi:hypothetical protein